MIQTEKFYRALQRAMKQMPESALPSVRPSLENALTETASQIVRRVNPENMSAVRGYIGEHRVAADDYILYQLIGSVLERSTEIQKDARHALFDMLRSLPLRRVLRAPVETPSELARWIAKKARK